MRVWVIEGGPGGDAGGLGALLRQWAGRAENAGWQVEARPPEPGLAADVRAHRPEVLVLAEEHFPAGSWLEELLALDAAAVVAVAADRAGPFLALAERFSLELVAVPASVEAVGLAVRTALAALRRARSWRARVEEVQRRLDDRILIERAKGVIVQRLGITEEEAYKRLRVLSRRQRRPIRDIAQALLDTQALLGPGAGDLAGQVPGDNHRSLLEENNVTR